MATERRPRSFLWPILLIGVGALLLLQNLGLISWSAWEIIGRFWPVILILIGIDLIFCRGNPWLAGTVAAVVVLVAIGGALIATATSDQGATTPSERLTQELGPIDQAAVELQFGAGDLAIGSLPGESGSLMEGDFSHGGTGRTVSRSFTCRDGGCTLRLSSENRRGWSFGRRVGGDSWQVNLSPRIPLNLRIQSGASRLNLDLSQLRLSALRLDVGASSGTITLPREMGGAAVVKAGAADLDFVVPEQTAARIRARGGLSSIQVDEGRFPREGDYYVSPDFATATNRLDLDLDAGVASVRIR